MNTVRWILMMGTVGQHELWLELYPDGDYNWVVYSGDHHKEFGSDIRAALDFYDGKS